MKVHLTNTHREALRMHVECLALAGERMRESLENEASCDDWEAMARYAQTAITEIWTRLPHHVGESP